MTRRQYAFTLAMVIISAVVGAMIAGGMVAAKSSQPQQAAVQTPGPPKWEYQIVFGGPKNGGYAISELNKLSEQGYEVAGYSTTADVSGRQSFSVLMRRVKP